MSQTIDLTRGHVTIVDDEDYEWLSHYQWRATGKRWIYATARDSKVLNSKGNPKDILMHRLILGLVDAPWSTYTDHINGNTLDNQRSNLRITDNKGNQGNRDPALAANGTSQYRGVVYHRPSKKYAARIRIDRHLHHIGLFSDDEDAALAYDIAARLHFREFASLNLPHRQGEHALFFLTRFAALDGVRGSYACQGVNQRPNGRWRAYVTENGNQNHLGTFDTREEAIEGRTSYLQSKG